MKSFKVLDKEDNKIHILNLTEILEEVNTGRSNEWTNYDVFDWYTGWMERVNPCGFLELILDNIDIFEIKDIKHAENDTFSSFIEIAINKDVLNKYCYISNYIKDLTGVYPREFNIKLKHTKA